MRRTDRIRPITLPGRNPVPFPSTAAIVRDERGTAAIIPLDPALHTEEAALRAAYLLSERCDVHLRHEAAGGLVAELRVKDGTSLTEACGAFCTALTDAVLRARISAETAGLQEALLRRAFLHVLPRTDGG